MRKVSNAALLTAERAFPSAPVGGGTPAGSVRVEVEAASGYELLMGLVAYEDAAQDRAGTIAEGREWLADVRRRATAELLEEVSGFSGGSGWVWGNLTTLVSGSPAPRDAGRFIGHVEHLDPLEVRLHLLGHYLRPFRRETPPEITHAAALGDETAAAEVLATSFPDDATWQAALRALLPLTPAETHARLLAILRSWRDDVFGPAEPAIVPVLERDAAAKRALIGRVPAHRLIETATNGWDYVPEPGVERVRLVPSVLLRPWVLTADLRDLRIFVYPVADEAFDETGGPPRRLVQQLEALGDERRLRLLKRLSGGPAALHELAKEFGVSKTTLLHHLVVLRAAGLVRLHDTADRQYSPHAAGYHLRAEVVDDVYRGLVTYLGLRGR